MIKLKLSASLLILFLLSAIAHGQGTAFTYQGKLTDNGSPASGQYDLQFKLFDTATVATGTQLGTAQTLSNVTVSNGIFTAQLDFGACASCFNGAARFLEIAVKPTAGGTFTTLAPRQPITSTPYALKSQAATAADGLSVACVNCITSSQIQNVLGSQVAGNIAGSQINGAIPVASVPAGSANYIQNATSQQAASNFNISGSGTVAGTLSAGVVNAATQFNLGGQQVLSAEGTNNLFAGLSAGTNSTGSNNSFLGQSAGLRATTGIGNSFVGMSSGAHATTGMNNTFVGFDADFNTLNPTGDNNTLVGAFTTVNSGVTNATAIGAKASATQNNSVILGSINGVNGATVDSYVGIGTTTPGTVLDVERETINGFTEAARFTSYGSDNVILSRASNGTRIAPRGIPKGRRLLELGGTGFNGLSFVDSAKALITLESAEDWTSVANGTLVSFFTTPNGTTFTPIRRMTIDASGLVGVGTSAPADRLDVSGDIRAGTSGTNGCLKNNNGGTIIGTCSSDARFKRDITPFPNLLSRLVQLRPVHFYWRAADFPERRFGRAQEAGLVAQDVERVMPELVTSDEQGYKAVDYSRLPLLTLQAIKELKAENDALRQRLDEQRNEIVGLRKQVGQIEALKRILCQSVPDADLCRSAQ